ncbi:multidrug efflux pump subunit AcrA (membrane-fusion protein) [Lewinella marina]|uniref:HlyD family secretion protein n=1 Tax=Neolewinella marina TaxID=438751 RepID=A0A2G0CBB3_9BACT|nr:HlyD family efflux transporter periplasmic adaptor subunit [Neolewinella marina]NJB87786.1 multidrug efflux pump subunit AcrA (membrane-fusion protein) [Neolewinella marina]PHK97256.1 HlyD family secretion protein [Neolewinella marina]
MKNKTVKNILKFLLGAGIIALGFFGMRYLSSLKEEAPRRPVEKRVRTVETRTINNADLATTLDVQGRLQAYNKIELYSEVGGAVEETGRPLKEGTYFPKGAVILRIDDDEARLNLQAQKATLLNSIAQIMPDLKIDYPASFPAWEAYLNGFNVDEPLPPLPTAADQREKLFVAGRNLYTQYYNIKSQEERLSKYLIRAPFAGVLTAVNIDRGAVVRAGQALGELMATGYYEMVATVPLSDLGYLSTGGKVRLYSEDIDGEWTGTINRISDQIDEGSQTVEVYIGVNGRELREGMYMRGEAAARTLEDVVEIDRTLLIDEREVYVVRDDTLLILQPVTVRKTNRRTAIVSGLPDGTQLLTSTVPGAFDGMRVRIKEQEQTTEITTADTGGETAGDNGTLK